MVSYHKPLDPARNKLDLQYHILKSTIFQKQLLRATLVQRWPSWPQYIICSHDKPTALIVYFQILIECPKCSTCKSPSRLDLGKSASTRKLSSPLVFAPGCEPGLFPLCSEDYLLIQTWLLIESQYVPGCFRNPWCSWNPVSIKVTKTKGRNKKRPSLFFRWWPITRLNEWICVRWKGLSNGIFSYQILLTLHTPIVTEVPGILNSGHNISKVGIKYKERQVKKKKKTKVFGGAW